MSGVVPQVAAMLGHCAAGTAYIPALADFIPMVQGHVVDGPRRPPPGAGGHGRGRHRGGDGRLRGAHQGLGRRRPRGRLRRGVPRRGAPLPVVLPVATTSEAPPVVACDDPVDRRVEQLYKIVPTAPRRAYDMVKVIEAVVDDGDFFADQAGLRPQPRHRARPGRRDAGGHRGQPADGARRRARRERGRQGGPLRVAVRRLRHPARVPPRRARLHRRLGGGEAGHHPPRRQDAVRRVARRRCRRSRSSCARATAPGTS